MSFRTTWVPIAWEDQAWDGDEQCRALGLRELWRRSSELESSSLTGPSTILRTLSCPGQSRLSSVWFSFQFHPRGQWTPGAWWTGRGCFSVCAAPDWLLRIFSPMVSGWWTRVYAGTFENTFASQGERCKLGNFSPRWSQVTVILNSMVFSSRSQIMCESQYHSYSQSQPDHYPVFYLITPLHLPLLVALGLELLVSFFCSSAGWHQRYSRWRKPSLVLWMDSYFTV